MFSPFFTMIAFSFQELPPVACGAVFCNSVTFSGTMRASKPA